MKDIFNLNKSEKFTILEMHKSATKRQYLSENTPIPSSPPISLTSEIKSSIDTQFSKIKEEIPSLVYKFYPIDKIFSEVTSYIISTIPLVYKGMIEGKSGYNYSTVVYNKINEIFDKHLNSIGKLTKESIKKIIPNDWKNRVKNKTNEIYRFIVDLMDSVWWDAYLIIPKDLQDKALVWSEGQNKWYDSNGHIIVPNILFKIDKALKS